MEYKINSEVISNIPLIPLRDLIVFPSTLVPFIIGRQSSIKALERATSKDKLIFLSAQMDASLDNPRPQDIYTMGVVAKIVRAVKMDDRNIKIIVEGKKRARILEYLSTYPFYQVLIKEVREFEEDNVDLRETLKKVLDLFEEYLKLSQNASFDSIIPALRDNSPGRVADIISSHLYISLEEKQNLLETINSNERIRRLMFVLENEILKIQAQTGKGGTRKTKKSPPFRSQKQKVFPSGLNMKSKEDQPNEIEELKAKVAEAGMP